MPAVTASSSQSRNASSGAPSEAGNSHPGGSTSAKRSDRNQARVSANPERALSPTYADAGGAAAGPNRFDVSRNPGKSVSA